MNDLYLFIQGTATEPLEIVFNIVIFYFILQLIGVVISELIQFGRKG